MTKPIWATVLGIAAFAGLVLMWGTPPPARAPERAQTKDLARGVRVTLPGESGPLAISIEEIRRETGRRGFFRSPLLGGLELRNVRIERDGALVESFDRISIGALGGGREVSEQLGSEAKQELDDLIRIIGDGRG